MPDYAWSTWPIPTVRKTDRQTDGHTDAPPTNHHAHLTYFSSSYHRCYYYYYHCIIVPLPNKEPRLVQLRYHPITTKKIVLLRSQESQTITQKKKLKKREWGGGRGGYLRVSFASPTPQHNNNNNKLALSRIRNKHALHDASSVIHGFSNKNRLTFNRREKTNNEAVSNLKTAYLLLLLLSY